MVKSDRTGSGHLVCGFGGWTTPVYPGRLLVRLCQHSSFSVPIIALVFSHFYLGSVSLAGFPTGFASRADTSRPRGGGGLGFLGESAAAFIPLLLSQGASLAGNIANHIFYAGKKLLDFKLEIVAVIVFFCCSY